MRKAIKDETIYQIEKNIMFVSTIYDSFEALEETLIKLKLDEPRLLVNAAKKSFANEVFKYAQENNIYIDNDENFKTDRISFN